jgi:hypothetical protein
MTYLTLGSEKLLLEGIMKTQIEIQSEKIGEINECRDDWCRRGKGT